MFYSKVAKVAEVSLHDIKGFVEINNTQRKRPKAKKYDIRKNINYLITFYIKNTFSGDVTMYHWSVYQIRKRQSRKLVKLRIAAQFV